MSQNNSTDDQEDRQRRLNSFEALLRFCVQNTKAEDATGESAFTEMTPEVSIVYK